MNTIPTERLLYESGKIELWVRLLFALFGLSCVCGAFFCIVHNLIIPAALSGVFGLLFLLIWVYKWQMFYDSNARQLIFRSLGTWRISLADAEALYVREGRSGPLASGSHIDIGLRYKNGRDRLIISQPQGDPKRIALIISEATELPIVQV